MIITEENNISGIDFQEVTNFFPNSLDMNVEDYENWLLEKELSGLLDRCPPSQPYLEKRYRYLLSENFLEVRISPKFRSPLPVKEFNWRFLKDQYYRICQSLIPLPSFLSYLFLCPLYLSHLSFFFLPRTFHLPELKDQQRDC